MSSTEEATVANDYSLMKVIGKGAFSVVYLAQKHDVYYSVKVAYTKNKWKISEQEYQILSQITNANITRCIHLHEIIKDDNDNIALVLTYAKGEPLSKYIRKLSNAEILRLGYELLEVLKEIHSVGIAHLDIKLANIIYEPTSGVTLIDFGLAVDTASNYRGTPRYISQEMYNAFLEDDLIELPILMTSDYFALGVTLYILAIDKYPHKAVKNVKPKPSVDYKSYTPISTGDEQLDDLINTLITQPDTFFKNEK